MKRFFVCLAFVFTCAVTAFAQNNDLLLARQFAANGEPEKALELYAKLYKQDNEYYFTPYMTTLLSLKKFTEAETTARGMARKHPKE